MRRRASCTGGIVEREHVDDPVEVVGLGFGLFDGGVGFFHQRCVLLSHLGGLEVAGCITRQGRRDA